MDPMDLGFNPATEEMGSAQQHPAVAAGQVGLQPEGILVEASAGFDPGQAGQFAFEAPVSRGAAAQLQHQQHLVQVAPSLDTQQQQQQQVLLQAPLQIAILKQSTTDKQDPAQQVQQVVRTQQVYLRQEGVNAQQVYLQQEVPMETNQQNLQVAEGAARLDGSASQGTFSESVGQEDKVEEEGEDPETQQQDEGASQRQGHHNKTSQFTQEEPAALPAPAKAPPARRTRRKKDPNAPASVSSAYAFFFKDTQASVKTHNPSAKFGEVSKIVASMWDALDEEGKAVYRRRNEEDKRRHEREMKAYRARMQAEQEISAQPTRQQDHQKGAASGGRVTVTRGHHGSVRTTTDPSRTRGVTGEEEEDDDDDDDGDDDNEEEEVMAHSCIRSGCPRRAVRNAEWEDEYCSNECVVSHCKDVFAAWIKVLKTV